MFRKCLFSLLAGCLMSSSLCFADSVSVQNPGVWPIMKRARYNPVAKLTVQATEVKKPAKLTIYLDNARQVQKITLRSGAANGMDFKDSTEYGSGEPNSTGKVVITCTEKFTAGENILWLDVEASEEAIIGSQMTIKKMEMQLNGQTLNIDMEPISQRIGIMLGYPGEKVGQLRGAPRPCAAFRIPGIIQTQKGTLIGCFDARYDNEVDLCRDIDVAVVRSTDGGQTWTLPEVNMDSGPGLDNGCGDPCILQDKKGRIWMQALACHFAPGARAINASGKGTEINKTGQWEMVYSDNDGQSWSRIVNVTKQVKKDEWNLILAGPGNGICTKDGVIVFPAQIWQHDANPNCRSTICYSKDNGRTWKMGEGIPEKTSECQVVELKDGSLMLNCRNEMRKGKRIVYITKDLGQTWEAHESNGVTLNDPTCQASLVKVDSRKFGSLLLYSNPWIHGRSNMSVRASKDEGKTWNNGVLYDSRGCCGYSCIAMTDPDHVGIIYETAHTNGETSYRGIGFIRVPLETVVTGKDVPVKAAPVADSDKKARKDKKDKKGKKSKKGKKKKKTDD